MLRVGWRAALLGFALCLTLATSAAVVRAQLVNTLSTNTAVASGGTVMFAVNTPGVNIVTNTGLGTCTTTTTLPAPSVTYVCPTGLFVNANVQQTFSVATGPIAETVTYNANGPASVPAATTAGPTTCTSAASPFTCSVALTAPTVSGGTLSLLVTPAGGESVVVNAGPSLTCAQSPTPFSPSPTTSPVTVTYSCGSGQTIPASTVSLTVSTAPSTPAPSIQATMNANGPVSIPSPVTQPVSVSGTSSSAPTISFIDPSSGGPGTTVTVNGTNLTGVTAINFGTTSAAIVGCAANGSNCGVNAPALPLGTTVNVTVVTSAGPSNSVQFTYSGGPTPGPFGGPVFTFGPPLPPSQIGAGGGTIPFQSGWNLVGGANGGTINGVSGPMYTFQAGDNAYEIVSPGTPLIPGRGYWAYFPTTGTITLPLVQPQTQTVPLPPGAWIMVGNPSSSPVTLFGADIAYTYNPATNYQPTTTLGPGQGAWVLSFGGGTLTILP